MQDSVKLYEPENILSLPALYSEANDVFCPWFFNQAPIVSTLHFFYEVSIIWNIHDADGAYQSGGWYAFCMCFRTH